ncbi:protoporphyrinogen oxidase [Amycolatopsis cynarae]|uniref:Protoporphyrinogen oxidase n=1 Tax=Amycolatopsis cynarae TaxID=2995223 RepID=A0ABY7BC20_9PSEU|nr:flavodoxin domain-containing protein [Amycolatopsis sp. HUAS 11-8]WAL68964.1 protoporphyrinogen oxidase [Amycolatopsis sp. HUAS 11-8]
MKVLVAVASRHGGTREIAEEIGREMRWSLGEHSDVAVHPVTEVGGVSGYDAVVLGSAVYMGHWLTAATDFVHRNREELTMVPVWLFSSGPVGSPPRPEQDPLELGALRRLIRAREHRLFAGRIDRHRLGLAERALLAALHVADGDYRDWQDIRSWARRIAAMLPAGAERVGEPS